MYSQILILITTLYQIQCNIPQNTSDVYITYGGYVDLNPEPAKKPPQIATETTTTEKIDDTILTEETTIEIVTDVSAPIVTTTEYFAGNDDVVFVPNDRQSIRNEDDDDFLENRVRVDDLISGRRVGDYLRDDERVGSHHGTTETPNHDVFFVSGKNNENENAGKETKDSHIEGEKERDRKKERVVKPKIALDCKHLNCNLTQVSVCGAKSEHKIWKYRLFLNECFFRKVNCAFTHDINRYEQVDITMCNNIGARILSGTRRVYHPVQIIEEVEPELNSRKTFASRRSLNMGLNGRMCSHVCPISCPENYDPVCAVSGTGRVRVFENHCKLDENSCSYGVVWHTRPLPQCVGGKKADIQQNRHFISWMQKVGIVDNKGRLNLND